MSAAKKLWIAVVGIAGIFGGFSLGAQNVSNIVFNQQGKAQVQNAFIEHNTLLRKGMHFNAEQLDADIKRLYATGVFSDVSAAVDKGPDGNVAIRYTMKLKPLVRKFVIKGNEKLKISKLQDVATVGTDAPLNERNLRDTVSAIRKLYQEDGYNDARVDWKIINVAEGEVDVEIHIEENLKVRVNDVNFHGLHAMSKGELKEAMANRFNWIGMIPLVGKHLNFGLLNRQELEADEARIREVCYKYGYLDAKVVSVKVIPLADDPERADIDITLDEGLPYKIRSVEIAGAPAADAALLKGMLKLQKGETFSSTAENATIKAISNHYESLGHVDASIRSVRQANYKDHTVGIRVDVSAGRRYHVRQVNIVNNVYTKDKVIRRELAIQPGDPVDRSRIEVSRARLMGMGYFSKVEALTNNADDVSEKDVEFRVEEKEERFNFKIGAGFSDMNSLVGMTEISSKNFDLFAPQNWFYGGGQRFRIQGMYGIERAGFNVDFTEPWLMDLPIKLDVSGYWNQMEYNDWSEQRVGGRMGLSRKFFDDFTSATIGYKFEQVNVFDMERNVESSTKKEEGRQWVSQISLMLDRDTRDSLLMPTQGYNINFLASVSPKVFGSTNNFYRLEAKGSGYYSFFDKAIIVMAGFRAGVVADFDRDEGAPIFERYFLGGGDSLRGFSYRDVGPLDRKNTPVGGSTMMLGTFEISHPIWSFIRGAAFVDAGNVWENAYSFGPGGINVGAGYGLRLQIPMINAPVKLDLAYPIVNNQDNQSSKFRFHFNMGFTW